MDDLKKLNHRVWINNLLFISFSNFIIFGLFFYAFLNKILPINDLLIIFIIILTSTNILISILQINNTLKPLKTLWQIIIRLNSNTTIPMPQINDLKYGKDIVLNLNNQIVQLSNVTSQINNDLILKQSNLNNNLIAKNLPLPLIITDNNEIITYVNKAFAQYIGLPAKDIIGKSLYTILNMSFTSEDTFDNWLKTVKLNSAVASKNWERVRLIIEDNHPTRQFDLAAFYNQDNPANIETILVLFDHTKQYSQDDQAISFVALSVHELRTPLTLLRGYIEVLEEELKQTLNPQLKNFLNKMDATAQQLTAFVNNILNVARIDDDQLELKLQAENWPDILKNAINDIRLRAKVRGITIQYEIEENLPTVGVDRISIYEVISNIIDNAIKYSGRSNVINIHSYINKQNLIETSIQDFGLGINNNILPNLFTKFYRDHHNRAQIGGTGLGLYLCKAIISAHGGNIWVTSKINQGTTFYFTLLPYDGLTKEMKDNNLEQITKTAHGWIKNHSLYRR